MTMPAFLQEKKTVPLFAIFIIVLFPALLAFGSVLQSNFKSAAVQEAQKNLTALMYQSDRLVLDIDLELSFIDALLAEGLGRDGTMTTPDFVSIEAEYRSRARWPDLLSAAYLVENRQGRWTIRQVLGRSTSQLRSQSVLDSVQDYLAESRLADEAGGSQATGNTITPDSGIPGQALKSNHLFRVSSLFLVPELTRGQDNAAPELRPLLRLFVSQFDESVFTGDVLPVLVERYFGKDSGFAGFVPAVYRPDGSLAYVQADRALSAVLPFINEEMDSSTLGVDFSRPLFRDPGRFDVSRFYRGAAPRSTEPESSGQTSAEMPFGLATPGQGALMIQRFRSRTNGQDQPAGDEADAQQFSSTARLVPDYIEQYRFLTHSGRDDWQLAVIREGASISAAALQSARLKGLGAYGFLLLIYAAIVVLYFALHRTAALAERERAFFASVSHELKTPIAVVLSAGENLAKGIVEPSRVGAYGETLAKEARRLGSSVERLLIIAGLQSSQGMHRDKPQELSALVLSVLQKQGLEAAVLTAVAGKPLVTGSALLLESAIDSIISNALKYGSPPLELVVEERQQGIKRMAVMRCRDHGRGIPRSERRKVFEPFYRGSAAQQGRQAGTGIGLYLARRVARIHGGDARLFSAPGGGVIVELTFKAYP